MKHTDNGTILITPITKLLDKLKPEIQNLKHFNLHGWWKGIYGTKNGKKIYVLDCGPGEKAGDCVFFLKETALKKLIFFGFAGSYSNIFQTGEFCSPSSWGGGASLYEFSKGINGKTLPGQTARPFPNIREKKEKGFIYTLPSLFLEKRMSKQLKQSGVDLVDMETAHVVFAANDLETSFNYYVTDTEMDFKKIDYKNIIKKCLQLV